MVKRVFIYWLDFPECLLHLTANAMPMIIIGLTPNIYYTQGIFFNDFSLIEEGVSSFSSSQLHYHHFHWFLLIIITKSVDSLIGDIDQTFVSVRGKQGTRVGKAKQATLPFEGKSHPEQKSLSWGGKVLILDIAKWWFSSTRKFPYQAIMQEVMFYNPQLACLCRGWSAQFYCALFWNCKNLGKIFGPHLGTAKKMKTQRQFCLFWANNEWMDGYPIACTFTH